MKQKKKESPQKTESSPHLPQSEKAIDTSDILTKIDAALEKKKAKKKKITYWTCNNRFNGTGPPGICHCTEKYKATFRRSTSKRGLEVPIRCTSKGKTL